MTQCFVSVLLVWIKFQVHNLSNFFLTTDRGGGGGLHLGSPHGGKRGNAIEPQGSWPQFKYC
jgi:hypothetical protein